MPNRITKAQWVAMFQDIGLADETMMQWHRIFETRHPDAHKAFLGWLGVSDAEIATIRSQSQ